MTFGTRPFRARSGRRSCVRSGLAAPLCALVLAAAAGPLCAGVEIVTAEDVLSLSTVRLDGRLYLVQDGETAVPFITDIEDAEILNRGDGSFHRPDEETVREALAFVDERFIRSMDFRVVILPYPRSGRLRSTAEDGTVYLSPGVLPFAREQVHFLVTHEVGHVVHQTFLPDADLEAWEGYRDVRGIQNVARYHAGARHSDRPHEIFAEDFRRLYGGPLGSETAHENGALPDSRTVLSLRTYFASLLPLDPALASTLPLVFGPNPFRPGQRLAFRWDGAGAQTLEIIDVSGRQRALRTFRAAAGQGFTWQWDGRADDGRPLPSGIYFLRLTGIDGGAVGRLVLVN